MEEEDVNVDAQKPEVYFGNSFADMPTGSTFSVRDYDGLESLLRWYAPVLRPLGKTGGVRQSSRMVGPAMSASYISASDVSRTR
jgi:hypothetical protein